MIKISEYDKVKLVSGEIARIVEILEENVAYIAEIFKKSGVSVEEISHEDIKSVFIETEHYLKDVV